MTSILSIVGGSVAEGQVNNGVVFTVELSEPSDFAVSVNWRTRPGGALPGDDFSSRSGTLQFAPRETSKTIGIDDFNDSTNERDEAFVLELFDPVAATLEGDLPVLRATAWSLDNDGPTDENLAVFVSSPVIVEGDSGSRQAVFEVSLSREPDSPLTLAYQTRDGSAVAGADYVARSGTVSFAVGQRSRTVAVDISADGASEPSETFSLSVASGGPVAEPAAGVATILDDDTGDAFRPEISISGGRVIEGRVTNGVVWTVTLSEPAASAVTVEWRAVPASAVQGEDYSVRSGALTFAPGETSKQVSVDDGNDSTAERDEAVVVTLANPVNGVLAGGGPAIEAESWILDNDGGTPIALHVSDATLVEGDGGTRQAVFELSLSRPLLTSLTLPFETREGSARAGGDFVAASGSVAFAPGQTRAAVAVDVVGDEAVEGVERFSLAVAAGGPLTAGAAGIARILDDDAAPLPEIAIEGLPTVEGRVTSGNAFLLTLSEPSPFEVTVRYRTRSGSAGEGEDFSARAGVVTFAPGRTTETIVVDDFNDSTDEFDETVVVELFQPVNAALAGGATRLEGWSWSLDNDGVNPNTALHVSDPEIVEGDSGAREAVFEVSLSRPLTTPLTVAYETVAGAATAGSDFTPVSGTLTFAPGQTSAAVAVAVSGDRALEGRETFGLALQAAGSPVGGADGVAGRATILDDDAGGAERPTLSVESQTALEGASDLEATLVLSRPAAEEVSVAYRMRGGTALPSVDFVGAVGDTRVVDSSRAIYGHTPQRVVFAPGETRKTLTFSEFRFDGDEVDETAVIELFDPSGVALAGGAPALRETVWIRDNEGVGPNLALSVAEPTLIEGADGAREAVFEVSLSQPAPAALSFAYETRDGSATAGEDYAARSGTLDFAPGQRVAAVAVPVFGDAVAEAAETLFLSVTPAAPLASGAAGASGAATILDDDSSSAAQPIISVRGDRMQEGQASLDFVLALSQPSDQTVEVAYRFLDGTSDAAQNDWRANGVPTEGVARFLPGQTQFSLFAFPNRDSADEVDESIVLELREPVNAALAGGAPRLRATGWILDDDGTGPNLALFVSSPVLFEGDEGRARAVFEVALSRPAPTAAPITLDYQTVDSGAIAGEDYVARSGRITFAPGQDRAYVAVDVISDRLRGPTEGDEAFSLSVTPVLPVASGGAGAFGSATILNDDPPPVAGDALGNVLEGGRFGDDIRGFGGADLLQGRLGDDLLSGGDGPDTLEGGLGNDTLDGGAGFDSASYAGASAAVIASLANPAANRGDAGGDAYRGVEALIGSDFDDLLLGDAAANRIDGGLGADELVGAGGDDILFGEAGDDTLHGGAGADRLEGGDGRDLASYLTAAAGVVAVLANPARNAGEAAGDAYGGIEGLIGSNHADALTGGAASDVLRGAAGADTLDGGAGADTLDGGGGFDLVSYAASTGPVGARLDGGANWAGATGDRFVGVEGLIGSASADVLIGSNAGNRLDGGDGDDRLFGLGGDDLMTGGDGVDAYNGGGGVDTASYGSSGVGVGARLDGGASWAGAAGETFVAVENLIGSRFGDVLIGSAADNLLLGGAGDDRLFGLGGDDTLEGGAGADTLDGGAGRDAASYARAVSGGGARLDGGAGWGMAAGDVHGGVEDLIGSDFADALIGSAGANALSGGAGDDRLFGLGGDDTLEGGAGADTLDGGAGRDRASYAGAATGGGARLDGAPGWGMAAGDVHVGIEDLHGSAFVDVLVGDEGANLLAGGAAGDRLFGLAGDDTLLGGAGPDRLNGGAGSDTASYADAAGGLGARLDGGPNWAAAAGDAFLSIENLEGSAFADVLIGGVGANRLTGGAGNDRLYGLALNDRFAFAGAGFGDDVIEDFEDGVDLIDFSDHAGAAGLGDLAISGVGSDALIALGGDSILLRNVDPAALTAADFDFG